MQAVTAAHVQLPWADLSPDDVASLQSTTDLDHAARLLTASNLVKHDDQRPDRQLVLVEFYINLLRFARERAFTPIKLSTLFSLFHRAHTELVDGFLTLEKTWAYFRALLLAHSVQRPPYSVAIFTVAEAELITQYALDNYFRHFSLFRRIFTMRHVKEMTMRKSHIELPPASFVPLAAAMVVPRAQDGPGDGAGEEGAADVADEQGPDLAAVADADALDLPPGIPDDVAEAIREQLEAQVASVKAQLEAQQAHLFEQLERKLSTVKAGGKR